MKTLAIVGGGASGMTAAITAARANKGNYRIILIEHTDRLGRKLLVTGNGKCNLTNRRLAAGEKGGENLFRGTDPQFAYEALNRFGLDGTIAFFESLGLKLREKNGYFYPYSEQAAVVNDVLRAETERLGVTVYFNSKIKKITHNDNGFRLSFEEGKSLSCDKLILAAGSAAAPKTGSDGSGYELCRSLGHNIIKPLPSLVQLVCQGSFWKGIAGVRADAGLTLFIDAKRAYSERGELQLTEYGISGIPVFQLSHFAVRALDCGKKVSVDIDFLPDIDREELIVFLQRQKCVRGKTAEEGLNGLLNKKLSVCVAGACGIKPSASLEELDETGLVALADKIKGFGVNITSFKSFDAAQVCSGGADTAQIEAATMESKLVKGLYFAGELIDIDGACGGYNLQWAWTSGYIAGISAVTN